MILGINGILATSRGIAYTPPLDIYTSATGAYSLRKLRSAYTGSAIIVRRSSDNTSLSIGFNSDGSLNTSQLLSFVGSGNGYVTIWYNQDGNSAHYLENTTLSEQPQIVENGVVLVDSNGKPHIRFTNQRLSVASGFGWNINTSSLFYLGNSIGNAVNYAGLISMQSSPADNPEIRLGLGSAGNSNIASYWNGSYQINGAYNLGLRKVYSSLITGNKTHTVYGNTSQLATGSKTGTFNNLSEFTIGGYRGSAGFQNGFMSELIIYTTDQTSNRNAIESNINTYYTIY